MMSNILAPNEIEKEVLALISDIRDGRATWDMAWLTEDDLEFLAVADSEELAEWANDHWEDIGNEVVGDGHYWKSEFGLSSEAVRSILRSRKTRILRKIHLG